MEAIISLLLISHMSTRGSLQGPEGGQEEQNLGNTTVIPTKH